MAQKSVVFATHLDTSECADVFKEEGEAARGGVRNVLRVANRMTGNGELPGFYTPDTDSVFGQLEEKPDFMVGVKILKFGPGFTTGPGDGVHVHMYINDKGPMRNVELVAQHRMMDGRLAAKLVRRFLDSFLRADPTLLVKQENI